eukprot:286645-Ditylum_brightwellii.AAC.1
MMFGVGCNIKSRGQGSIMVQKRGFESLYGDGEPVIQGNDSAFKCNRYVCGVIDSRKSMNCLAGVNCVYQPGYFLTTTLNSKHHPGIKRIRSMVDKFLEEYMFYFVDRSHIAEEYSASLMQAAMVPIFHCYNKVFDSFFRWIIESKEKSLGEIEAYWCATECWEIDNKPS